jgi:hypothetical protein
MKAFLQNESLLDDFCIHPVASGVGASPPQKPAVEHVVFGN